MDENTAETVDLMSVNALAKHYGLDRRTVERRLKGVEAARVQRIAGRNFKLYDADLVREVLQADSDSDELKAAYERLHSIRADIKRYRRALRTRELMTSEEAEEIMGGIIQTLKARTMGLDAKLAPQIVAINERKISLKQKQRLIEALITSEVEPIAREAESILADTRLLS